MEQDEIKELYRLLDKFLLSKIEMERKELQPPSCPHIPECFEKSDFCWNWEESYKRTSKLPNFP